MSFDAIRWALAMPVSPSSTKFLLVAMADCVNSEGAEAVCWPSYAYLARRTGMNAKTVEAGVYRLKDAGFLVDTGQRAGDTNKVVVYRLNDPKTGAIKPGPQDTSAIGTRPSNATEIGAVSGNGNPPKFNGNPPNLGGESPQIVEEMPPKTGGRSSNGTSNRSRKEASASVPISAVSGVPQSLLNDWLTVRKDKKAKTLTETAVHGLLREASKAGLTPEEAVRFCCEANWVSFNAGWYEERVGRGNTVDGKQETFV